MRQKRESRDQGREDIIKSLIVIYIIHIKVNLNIYKRKACLKRYVFRHDLKADSESTVLSWSGMLFHKVTQFCRNGGYHRSLFWW